jgi:hypothetical protein
MGRGEANTWSWWGHLRESGHLEDPGVDGRIILRMNLQVFGCGSMDWIGMAQDMDRWQALANAVMSLWVP